MLALISNKCCSGCTHCMQDSRPDGPLMEAQVFERLIELATLWGNQILIISGGEPFEHPELYNFCKMASKADQAFCICTNGLWLDNEKKRWTLEKISNLRTYAGCQVYSNPKWYPHDKECCALWSKWEAWGSAHGILKDPHDIRGMLPFGRASHNEEALKEVENQPYHMSCLKAHLVAHQVDNPIAFERSLHLTGSFCKPVVDWFGNIRMSECVQCPVTSNVFKHPSEVWADLKQSKPCYKCSLAKKFIREAEESPLSKVGLSYKILKGDDQ